MDAPLPDSEKKILTGLVESGQFKDEQEVANHALRMFLQSLMYRQAEAEELENLAFPPRLTPMTREEKRDFVNRMSRAGI